MGFIESVPKSDIHKSDVHYLPHHGILKNSASTPIRIVYDCSSKIRGQPSLNDCLLTGPSMVNELTSVLMRFRLNEFACTSDIQKAYLMVGLNESDRDYCRFFWPENPLDANSEIITYRFRVVLFGSTASQFLLNSTIKFHLQRINDDVAQSVLRNIYIDNLQNTFTSENDLIDYYNKVNIHFNSAGFKLKQWQTNSPALSRVLSDHKIDVLDTKCNILGMSWNSEDDTLSIPKYEGANNEIIPTKRPLPLNVKHDTQNK